MLLERNLHMFVDSIKYLAYLLIDIDDEFLNLRFITIIEMHKNMLNIEDYKEYMETVMDKYNNKISYIATNCYQCIE